MLSKVSCQIVIVPALAGEERRRETRAAARRGRRAFMAAGRGWKEARGKECGGRGGRYHKSFSIETEKN